MIKTIGIYPYSVEISPSLPSFFLNFESATDALTAQRSSVKENSHPERRGFIPWRRGWDLNPRYAGDISQIPLFFVGRPQV